MNYPLVVGNWKMNGTIEETLKLITEVKNKIGENNFVEVVVAPPFTALYSAQIILQETSFKLAAQNVHWETEGAFTGEVSPLFLKDIGCTYVIIGHSERRRQFGETDEAVNRKILSSLAAELVPIFCIGETQEERVSGKTEAVLENQMKKGLKEVSMNDLKEIVIAYEPVWAIGTGQTASIDQVETAHYFVRNYLAKRYDAPTANTLRLLYGGSVTPDNAGSLFRVKNVNGFLVGGASLSSEKFVRICQAREGNQ